MSEQDNTRMLAEPAHKTAQIAEAERKVIEAARKTNKYGWNVQYAIDLEKALTDLDALLEGVTLQEITADQSPQQGGQQHD